MIFVDVGIIKDSLKMGKYKQTEMEKKEMMTEYPKGAETPN